MPRQARRIRHGACFCALSGLSAAVSGPLISTLFPPTLCRSLPPHHTHQVEGFWAIYSHLARLSDLPIGSEYFVFKVGIKPMWEVRIDLSQ
jgi:hypothetical protein